MPAANAGVPERGHPDAAAESAAHVVDLRRLLRTSVLLEMILGHIRHDPWRILEVVRWSTRGRSHLELRLAACNDLDVDHLPVDEHVLEEAASAACGGRRVLLSTTGHGVVAERIASRFKLFSGVVETGAAAESQLRRFTRLDAVPAALASSLRIHQWVKNALVFAPITLAGQLGDSARLTSTFLAFLAMCLVASATYLLNDLWDLADDRRHWSKRSRPLASGALPIGVALAAIPAGVLAGLGLAATISAGAAGVLLLYIALTVAYSLALKRLALVDGLVLATLYALRLALGVEAASVPPSPWLFVFAMFLFASLSYAKRHVEIGRVQRHNGSIVNGRGYRAGDAPLVLAVGVSTGIGAVLILVLYIIEDAFAQAFYGHEQWLWGLPPLLFLMIARLWLTCHRGEMNDDPVAFVLRDRTSLGLSALMLACFGLACFGLG